MDFDEIKEAIHSLRETVKPLVEENKKEVEHVIEQQVREHDYLDHLLDRSLKLCYNSNDHSEYLNLVKYIRTFDPEFAEQHYKFYREWFEETDE